MLKVSPWKGVIHFGKQGKLNPMVHSTFHVSNFEKCLSDESLVIPLVEIQIDDKLRFVEEPVEIMDREVKRLKQIRIPIVKVRWNSRRGPEFTWEGVTFLPNVVCFGSRVSFLPNVAFFGSEVTFLSITVRHALWLGSWDTFRPSYGCFVRMHISLHSLLLTSMCCDDAYLVTPRVSALAGCDNYMVRDVSNQEIRDAIFAIGDNKAPGPDGYSAAFFKEAWDIIAADVSRAIKEFFTNGVLLKELNHTIML
ncbi:hypothetical protein Tco_1071850 [Tanacetum coccineum]